METARVGTIWMPEEARRRDLGDLEPLGRSMEQVGLLQPVIIGNDMRLLAGERRLTVAARGRWDQVPVVRVRTFEDLTSALYADRQAMAPSTVEPMRSWVTTFRRWQALMAYCPRVSTSRYDKEARADLAHAWGVSDEQVRRMRGLAHVHDRVDLPRAVRVEIDELWAELEAGTKSPQQITRSLSARGGDHSIISLYGMGQGRAMAGPSFAEPVAPPPVVGPPPREQRAILTKGVTTVTAVADAFRQVPELHDKISPDEAADWYRSLREARKELLAMSNKLKERTNAAGQQ